MKARDSIIRRAWMLDVSGFARSVVSAYSRGQAIAIGLRSLHEAEYRSYRFTDIRCIRMPKHDVWAALDQTGHCWDEKLLPASTERNLCQPATKI